MIHPVLFIGIGGSGRSTLHWLYDDIRRDLIENGWPWIERSEKGSPMPRCWGFIAIDAEYEYNKDDPDVPAGEIHRVAVAQHPDTMAGIHEELCIGNSGLSRLGWMPPQHEMPSHNPYEGMGQYRSLGRMAMLARLQFVVGQINRAASAIFNASAGEDVIKLGQLYSSRTSSTREKAKVVLVSSLSGGTGSGMWLDVAQYLASRPNNKVDAWLKNSLMSLLYLPEVYENVTPNDGIAPNSMYALGELLAAYADRAPSDAIGRDLGLILGGANHKGVATAPRSMLFVGRQSAGLTLETPSEVYAATARTLSALLLNQHDSAGFDRVRINQVNANNVPLLSRSSVPSSNVGFGRLDLGLNAFREYTARRLFRSTVRRLTEPVGDKRVDKIDLAKAIADSVEEEFFTACMLNEKDLGYARADKRNQILDGIDRVSRKSTVRRFAASFSVQLAALRKTRRDADSNPIKALRKSIENFRQDEVTRLMNGVVTHANHVDRATVDAVAEYATRHSVPVAIELLLRLDLQLADAHGQLRLEGKGRDVDKYELEFASDMSELAAGRVFNQEFQQDLIDAAVAFIEATRTYLVDPLRKMLSDWLELIELQIRGVPWLTSEIVDWDGVTLPKDLEVPQTVVLLNQLDDVDGRFRRLMEETFDTGFATARQAATRELALGIWPDVPPKLPGVRSTKRQSFARESGVFTLDSLRPEGDSDDAIRKSSASMMRQLRAGPAVGAVAFEFVSLTELREWAGVWSKTRAGIGKTIPLGIREWLNHNEGGGRGSAVVSLRSDAFVEKLKRAITVAAPTSIYDEDAAITIHGKKPRESVKVMMPFPFSRKSALGSEVDALMEEVNLELSGSDFNPNMPDVEYLDFIRLYPDGLHPLALSSVTGPIQDEFANVPQGFWNLRHGRPLSQSLGLTPTQLVAIARGWLTAVSMNLIDVDTGQIWLNDAATLIPREYLDLGGTGNVPKKNGDWLRVALESFLPRLVKFTLDRHSLDWYKDLAALGGYEGEQVDLQESDVNKNGIDGVLVRTRKIPNQTVSAWLAMGKPGPGGRVPTVAVAGPTADFGSRDDRLDALKKWLSKIVDELNGFATEASRNEWTYLTVAISVEEEMFPHFVTAASQMINGLDQDASGHGPRRSKRISAGD